MATIRPLSRPREHTKSRRGCIRCKVRKVKCDETHPSCRNCVRLGTACTYGIDQTLRATSQPAPGIGLASLSPQPMRTESDAETRLLDLRLLHHYTTMAYRMLPFAEDPDISHYWAITVPKMAFGNELLLDAVLATTAFHMATYHPDQKELRQMGYRYYSRAISRHSNALTTINRSTADLLCVSSFLIMIMTFHTTRLRSVSEPYSPPSRWFRIIRGMGNLFRCSDPFLEEDGLRTIITRAKEESFPQDLGDSRQLPHLPDLSDLLFHDELAAREHLDECKKSSRQQFNNIVHGLYRLALAGISKHWIRYQLLVLAVRNNDHFLELVEQQDTLTIILLSHYFALLQWADCNWWLQNELGAELSHLRCSIPEPYRNTGRSESVR